MEKIEMYAYFMQSEDGRQRSLVSFEQGYPVTLATEDPEILALQRYMIENRIGNIPNTLLSFKTTSIKLYKFTQCELVEEIAVITGERNLN